MEERRMRGKVWQLRERDDKRQEASRRKIELGERASANAVTKALTRTEEAWCIRQKKGLCLVTGCFLGTAGHLDPEMTVLTVHQCF